MAVILITGGRAPATLHLARLLAAEGHKVLEADSVPYSLAGASRTVAATFRVPAPAQQTAEYIASLREIVLQHAVALLIPTCEEIFYLAAFRSQIPCPVFAPDLDVLRILHNKFTFNGLLRQLDLPAPETRPIQFPEAGMNAPPLPFPLVLKPAFSRFGGAVKIIERPDDWLPQTRSLQGEWLCQQMISGRHFASWSVATAGHLQTHTLYPLRWRFGATGAATWYRHTEAEVPKHIVARIAQHLNLSGQIALDFIHSDADGRWYAIECNPRSTSGIGLYEAADGLSAVFLSGKGGVSPGGPARKLAIPMLMAAGLRMFTPAFWQDWRHARDIIWSIRDPKPGLRQVQLMAYWLRMAQRQPCSLTDATTLDIAWNG